MADPCPSIHPADLFWQNSVIASFENGWLASTVYRNRNSRRYSALLKFWNRWRSGKIHANLPSFVLYAPSEAEAGSVSNRSLNGIFCYLAPQTEFDSQADVDFTLGHEFGHIELKHYLLPAEQRGLVEIEADQKAAEWGFPKRKKGKRIFSRLVERPL